MSVTIQDIYPNSQDTSNFYLENIYQLLADPNRSNFSLPSSPLPFSPPTYAVWVNALWFLSLVISLTCALIATLIQQWARKYTTVTQKRLSAHKRVRVHAFFSEGVEKFLLPWMVEALPTLLHLSLYLFFSGLVLFLWHLNLTIFKLVLSWVSICTVLYGCFTVMPIISPDSPYHTPLSSSMWFVATWIPFVILRAIRWLGKQFSCQATNGRLRDLERKYRKLLSQGMRKSAEVTARTLRSEIDNRTFMRTFESLDDDSKIERFFAGLPGFRDSRVVTNPLLSLTEKQKSRLSEELTEFMDRTFSSDLLPESVKNQRAIICVKVIDPAHFPKAFQWMFDKIVSEDQYESFLTPKIGHIVKGWGNRGDQRTDLLVKAMVSGIIARAQRNNDRWFTLASNELGVRKSVLQDYATQGDNLSLAILIHVIRNHFHLFHGQNWQFKFSFILETASQFNMQDTSPDLQHEFCVLWNEVVHHAKGNNSRLIPEYILRCIRNIYIALHKNTDAAPTRFSSFTSDDDRVLLEPSSYPACNVPDHHPDSASHIHEATVRTTSAPDFVPRAGPTSAGSSSSVLTRVPAIARPMEVLPVDNSTSTAFFQSAHRIPAGGLLHSTAPPLELLGNIDVVPRPVLWGSTQRTASRIKTKDLINRHKLPRSTAAGAAQGNNADRTVAHPTAERSTSTHLLPSISPPGAGGHQLNADPPVSSSDGSDIPSSSPIPVLDDIPIARPKLFSDPLSGHAPPGPESQPVIPAAPPPAQSVSEPELCAAIEGESSTKAAISKDEDASDLPIVS